MSTYVVFEHPKPKKPRAQTVWELRGVLLVSILSICLWDVAPASDWTHVWRSDAMTVFVDTQTARHLSERVTQVWTKTTFSAEQGMPLELLDYREIPYRAIKRLDQVDCQTGTHQVVAIEYYSDGNATKVAPIFFSDREEALNAQWRSEVSYVAPDTAIEAVFNFACRDGRSTIGLHVAEMFVPAVLAFLLAYAGARLIRRRRFATVHAPAKATRILHANGSTGVETRSRMDHDIESTQSVEQDDFPMPLGLKVFLATVVSLALIFVLWVLNIASMVGLNRVLQIGAMIVIGALFGLWWTSRRTR